MNCDAPRGSVATGAAERFDMPRTATQREPDDVHGCVREDQPRKWVLVADDNARLRALWVEVLEKVGYRAVGSEDGPAAADLIRDSSRT